MEGHPYRPPMRYTRRAVHGCPGVETRICTAHGPARKDNLRQKFPAPARGQESTVTPRVADRESEVESAGPGLPGRGQSLPL